MRNWTVFTLNENMKAKKSLGQNFLSSNTVAKDIVRAARISKEDTVLEIGPGRGIMTGELLLCAKKIIAVEKDAELVVHLNEKFKKEIRDGKLILVSKDILKFNINEYKKDIGGSYKIVANIPYYITGLIIKYIFSQSLLPESTTMLVQKEVALRIVARDKKESILSNSIKVYGTPEYIKSVPAKYFSPKPKVDSAVISIKNISRDVFANKKEEVEFFDVIKAGFSHKRKLLASNLRGLYGKDKTTDAFGLCHIDLKSRAEDLSVSEWICVVRSIH